MENRKVKFRRNRQVQHAKVELLRMRQNGKEIWLRLRLQVITNGPMGFRFREAS